AIGEMVRVLRPEGSLALAVWDNLDEIPAFGRVVELIDRLAGTQAAQALRAPFMLGNREDLWALFSNVGLTDLVIATQHARARFSSVQAMMEAELNGWLPAMGVEVSNEQSQQILDEAEQVLRPYVMRDGTLTFETSAHIVTGVRAAASTNVSGAGCR